MLEDITPEAITEVLRYFSETVSPNPTAVLFFQTKFSNPVDAILAAYLLDHSQGVIGFPLEDSDSFEENAFVLLRDGGMLDSTLSSSEVKTIHVLVDKAGDTKIQSIH